MRKRISPIKRTPVVTNPSVKYVTSFSPDPSISLGRIRLLCYLFADRVSKKVVKRAATKWPQPTARTVRKRELREMEKRRQGVLPL